MENEPENVAETPIVLGVILGSHGVSGRVRVKSFTDDPTAIGDYGPVRIGDVSHEIKVTGVSKGQLIVALGDVKDRDAADALRGAEMSIVREALGNPDADDESWYYTDLIGLKAETVEGKPFGVVEAVHDFGAGELLEISLPAGGETVMIGFTESNVPVVDIAGGRLVVDPPLGTIEVNEDKPQKRKRRRSPKARARTDAAEAGVLPADAFDDSADGSVSNGDD